MPLVSFRGTAAANAYGFLSSKKLVTETLPLGSSTWVAPNGVNRILTAVGKGADSVSSTYNYNINGASSLPGFATNTGWTDYSSLYSHFSNRLTTLNSGAPSVRFLFDVGDYFVFFNTATNTLWAFQNGTGISSAYGSAALNWTLPTSGTITTSINGTGTTNGGIQIPYYTQNNTTAFSLTFPGGTLGNPATNTTYTNISVTPGASYTIQNFGALTITYLL